MNTWKRSGEASAASLAGVLTAGVAFLLVAGRGLSNSKVTVALDA